MYTAAIQLEGCRKVCRIQFFPYLLLKRIFISSTWQLWFGGAVSAIAPPVATPVDTPLRAQFSVSMTSEIRAVSAQITA